MNGEGRQSTGRGGSPTGRGGYEREALRVYSPGFSNRQFPPALDGAMKTRMRIVLLTAAVWLAAQAGAEAAVPTEVPRSDEQLEEIHRAAFARYEIAEAVEVAERQLALRQEAFGASTLEAAETLDVLATYERPQEVGRYWSSCSTGGGRHARPPFFWPSRPSFCRAGVESLDSTEPGGAPCVTSDSSWSRSCLPFC
jgi:hypothetical protein